MTRYYFNLHEQGHLVADHEGMLLPSVDAARDRAIDAARSIMCAELTEGRLCLGSNIEVVDSDGRTAINMPFADAICVTQA